MSHLPVNCQSGFCEWKNINTLAVGSECQSANYTVEDDSRFAFSKQASITNRFEQPGAADGFARGFMKPSTEIPPDSMFVFDRKHNNKAVILHFAAIASYSNGTFEAVECLLFWQVWTIAIARYNGSTFVLDENITQTAREGIFDEDLRQINISVPCNYPNDTSCFYFVGVEAHDALWKALSPFLRGREVIRRAPRSNSVSYQDDLLTDLFVSTWLEAQQHGWDDPMGPPLLRTVRYYLQNLAVFITDNNRITSKGRKPGREGWEVQFFRIQYAFALYPALMLGLSMLLFVSTIWRTRGLEVWKNSQLPLLYHGFAQPVHDQTGELDNVAFMEVAAEEKRVVLKDSGDGLGLMLRDDRPIDK